LLVVAANTCGEKQEKMLEQNVKKPIAP